MAQEARQMEMNTSGSASLRGFPERNTVLI